MLRTLTAACGCSWKEWGYPRVCVGRSSFPHHDRLIGRRSRFWTGTLKVGMPCCVQPSWRSTSDETPPHPLPCFPDPSSPLSSQETGRFPAVETGQEKRGCHGRKTRVLRGSNGPCPVSPQWNPPLGNGAHKPELPSHVVMLHSSTLRVSQRSTHIRQSPNMKCRHETNRKTTLNKKWIKVGSKYYS